MTYPILRTTVKRTHPRGPLIPPEFTCGRCNQRSEVFGSWGLNGRNRYSVNEVKRIEDNLGLMWVNR